MKYLFRKKTLKEFCFTGLSLFLFLIPEFPAGAGDTLTETVLVKVSNAWVEVIPESTEWYPNSTPPPILLSRTIPSRTVSHPAVYETKVITLSAPGEIIPPDILSGEAEVLTRESPPSPVVLAMYAVTAEEVRTAGEMETVMDIRAELAAVRAASAGREAALETAETEQQEAASPVGGDPVLLSSGAYLYSEIDLEIPLPGDGRFTVTRYYKSSLAGRSGLMGESWGSSLDMRILRGTEAGLNERLEAVESQIFAAREELVRLRPALSVLLNGSGTNIGLDEACSRIEALTAVTVRTLNAYRAAREDPSALAYSAVLARLDEKITLLEDLLYTVLAPLQEHLTDVRRGLELKPISLSGDSPVLPIFQGLSFSGLIARLESYLANELNEKKEEAINRLALGEENERLNRMSGVPGAVPRAGLEGIIFMDEQGTPRIFRLDAPPDFLSPGVLEGGGPDYYPSGSNCTPETPAPFTLVLLPGGTFRMTYPAGPVLLFDSFGLLKEQRDLNGHGVILVRGGSGEIQEIRTTLGRVWKLSVNPLGYLEKITDPGGGSISFDFLDGRLSSVTDRENDTVGFEYDNHLLRRIVRPDGRERIYGYLFDGESDRWVLDNNSDEEASAFLDPGDPANRGMDGVPLMGVEYFSYDFTSRITGFTSTAGLTSFHFFDHKLRETRTELPDGAVEEREWDDRNRLVRFRDGKGDVWTYEWDELDQKTGESKNGILLFRWDYGGDGFLDEYTVYSRGRPRTIRYQRDSRGNVVTETRHNYQEPGSLSVRRFERESGRLSGLIRSRTDGEGHLIRFFYDEQGFLLRTSESRELREAGGVEAPGERREIWDRDEYGRTLRYRLSEGTEVLKDLRFRWNRDGLLLSRQDGLSGAFLETRTYNSRKDMITRTDENGGLWQYERDARHNLKKVINPLGETERYSLDGAGRILEKAVFGAAGQLFASWSYIYDTAGRISREVQNQTGLETVREYYPGGKLYRETRSFPADPGRGTSQTVYTYNAPLPPLPAGVSSAGLEAVKVTLDGVWDYWRLFEADSGLPAGEVSGTGRYTLTDTNGWGFLTKSMGKGGEKTVLYDREGRVCEEILDGISTLYEVNPPGNTVKGLDPRDAELFVRSNDGAGRLVYSRDARGVEESYFYDSRDRILGHQFFEGPEESWEYPSGDRILHRDLRGSLWERRLDRLGRIIAVTDPYGNEKTYAYDPLGRLILAADETGVETETGYNPADQVIRKRTGGLAPETFTYDPAGRLLVYTGRDGTAHEFRYSYLSRGGSIFLRVEKLTGGVLTGVEEFDADGYSVRTESPSGRFHSRERDNQGAIIRETDWANGTREFSISQGRPVEQTDFDGMSTLLSYDARGRIAEISHSPDSYRRFLRNSAGDVVGVETSLGRQTYGRDEAGLISRLEDEITGVKIDYERDSSGKVLQRLWSDGDKTAGLYGKRGEILESRDYLGETTSFFYDAAGRQTEIHYPGDLVQITGYNESGLISSEVLYRGTGTSRREVSGTGYAYDGAGRKRIRIDINGNLTLYRYDQQGRLAETWYPWDEPILNKGREERKEAWLDEGEGAPGGYGGLTSLEESLAAAAWKALPDGGTLGLNLFQRFWKETYGYNREGSRILKEDPLGRIEYHYDNPDPHQLTRQGNKNLEYDNKGNLIREGSGSREKSYSYDGWNRMIEFREKTLEGLVICRYTYDGWGRRVVRERWETASGGISSFRESWLYDNTGFTPLLRKVSPGDSVLPERSPVSGTGTRLRVLGPKSSADQRVTMLKKYFIQDQRVLAAFSLDSVSAGALEIPGFKLASAAGETRSRFFVSDIQNSIKGIINTRDASFFPQVYDSFGTPLGHGPDEEQLFGYNGKPLDPDSGFYNYGYRDYVPPAGRFSTVDPVASGSDWYAYCAWDPVNFTDFLGLSVSDLIRQTNGALSAGAYSNACNYRALQASAEQYLGQNLTAAQINEETAKLIASGALLEDYFVKRPSDVVNSALQKLGSIDTAVVTDYSPAVPENADATIIRGITPFALSNNAIERNHSQLGSIGGEVTWDPYYQNPVQMTTLMYRGIYFTNGE